MLKQLYACLLTLTAAHVCFAKSPARVVVDSHWDCPDTDCGLRIWHDLDVVKSFENIGNRTHLVMLINSGKSATIALHDEILVEQGDVVCVTLNHRRTYQRQVFDKTALRVDAVFLPEREDMDRQRVSMDSPSWQESLVAHRVAAGSRDDQQAIGVWILIKATDGQDTHLIDIRGVRVAINDCRRYAG